MAFQGWESGFNPWLGTKIPPATCLGPIERETAGWHLHSQAMMKSQDAVTAGKIGQVEKGQFKA